MKSLILICSLRYSYEKIQSQYSEFQLAMRLTLEAFYHFGPKYGQILLINHAERQKVIKADKKYETELTYHLIM